MGLEGTCGGPEMLENDALCVWYICGTFVAFVCVYVHSCACTNSNVLRGI